MAAQGPTIHSCAHEFMCAGPAVRSSGRGAQGKEEGGRGEEVLTPVVAVLGQDLISWPGSSPSVPRPECIRKNIAG